MYTSPVKTIEVPYWYYYLWMGYCNAITIKWNAFKGYVSKVQFCRIKFFNFTFKYINDIPPPNSSHYNRCYITLFPVTLGLRILSKGVGLCHIVIFSLICRYTHIGDFKIKSMTNTYLQTLQYTISILFAVISPLFHRMPLPVSGYTLRFCRFTLFALL